MLYFIIAPILQMNRNKITCFYLARTILRYGTSILRWSLTRSSTAVLGMVPPAACHGKANLSLTCREQKALLPTTEPLSVAKDRTEVVQHFWRASLEKSSFEIGTSLLIAESAPASQGLRVSVINVFSVTQWPLWEGCGEHALQGYFFILGFSHYLVYLKGRREEFVT